MRAPVLVLDLADLDDTRWPVYAPAMLAHDIHGVFALPVLVAGEYLGALDLFCSRPGMLDAEVLAGGLVAAELAGIPVLDLLAADLQAALSDPGSDVWDELATITRSEVSQATGMVVAQLEVAPAEALVRVRAHAYSTGRTVSEVARDILERRLRLEVA
jgi:ANTAR domain